MLRCAAVAICCLPERASHPLKVTDFSLYVIEMSAGHTIGIRARPLGMVRECNQIANLVDGKAELAATPNECQTLERGVVVLAIAIASPADGG